MQLESVRGCVLALFALSILCVCVASFSFSLFSSLLPAHLASVTSLFYFLLKVHATCMSVTGSLFVSPSVRAHSFLSGSWESPFFFKPHFFYKPIDLKSTHVVILMSLTLCISHLEYVSQLFFIFISNV